MTSRDTHPMLVADAGNSSVKIALVAKAGAKPRLLATLSHRDAGKLRALWKSVQPRTACAACVVPGVASALSRACPPMIFIGPKTPLNFSTAVDRRTVGADRLANMAEAARVYGRRVLVADFGTAATFDLLDARGIFAGGAIAPGLHTMARSLAGATAQLPEAVLAVPRRFTGRNTAEALRAGVAGGFGGMVRHLIGHLAGGGTRVVFTGGDARTAAKLANSTAAIDPLWTLRGIAVLGELAAREASK